MCAQLAHAAGESSPGNLPNGTHAVVLAARDEAELLEIEQKLLKANILHKSIREPDPPFYNALVAIGLLPVADRMPVRRILSMYPLIR